MSNPSPIAFNLLGRSIYWYGILIAGAIIVAVILGMREAKRRFSNSDMILDLALLMIPLGLVGARLYYVIFSWSHFAQDPLSILYVWEGGLAIYGAIIGGVVACVIFSKWRKINLLSLLDIAAPSVVLAQAIGRWGNFFNQEAFGPAITDPNLLFFPYAVKIDGLHYVNGVLCSQPYHMATFFYESLWCVLVFAFLFMMRKRFKHNGDVFLGYALLYSFERMFVEGLRQDSLWLASGSIRASQLLSVLIFVAVLAFIIVRHVKEKKNGPMPLFVLNDGPIVYPPIKPDDDANSEGGKTNPLDEIKPAEAPAQDSAEPAETNEPVTETKAEQSAKPAEEAKAEDSAEETITDESADANAEAAPGESTE